MSLFKKRILEYIDFKGVKKSDFYRNTGIARSVLDKSSGLTEDNVAKFIAFYEDVNPEWFLTGKGTMLKTDTSNIEPLHFSEKEQYEKTIHLLESALKDKEKIITLQEQRIESLKKGDFEMPPLPMFAESDAEYPKELQLKDKKTDKTRPTAR